MDEFEHAEFNELFNLFMNSLSKSDAIIGGHDVNANVWITNKMYAQSIGPFGLNNRNKKSRKLLGTILSDNLKIVNSCLTNLRILPGDCLEKDVCHT